MAGLGSSNDLDELDRYLSAPTEKTNDALTWWVERRRTYPKLSRMALDYLSIPGKCAAAHHWIVPLTLFASYVATSVDVERTFSRGRRLLTHVRSRLSAQTTRAILCLGDWVRWDLVRSEDVRAASRLGEVDDDGSDYEMEDGWDSIARILKEMNDG